MKIRIKNPIWGVPITFLYSWNPDQFEIVAFRKREDGKDLVFTRAGEREFNRTFVSLFDGDSWNDKKQRRENQWKDYLCKNSNYEGEPIDFFFPLLSNGCLEPLIKICDAKRIGRTIYKSRVVGNCIKSYHRILIQKINENNTNENIS